ncbi:MAG: HAMP domain-containing histidine kinase, partial [Acholeplasmatales bacterium]|nr:HAMP domain-containing histidine kinase [Acholeplasmatales bacterium]
NFFLLSINNKDDGRLYRVEINRIALIIEEDGIDSIDMSKYDYVTNVYEYSDDFYNTDSDYVIKEINGSLYRFEYTSIRKNDYKPVIIVNIVLTTITLTVLILLIFIRKHILKPFEKLIEVPYELSKGNLTIPLEEHKYKYFGRFTWGLNILRENIEDQKTRELELQKEKKTLLLSLSHDIKTPLSAIKLYSKALSKGLYKDLDKQKEIALSIDDNANEIEGFVSEIVRASKEDFLSLSVEIKEFYLHDLFKEISNYYQEKMQLVKIPFVINNYNNCLIKGDLERSIEILQNIIENAIKYGDGKNIEISTSFEDDCLLISTKNTGNTLSNDEISHIFESFYRGSNSKNAKGSGLGLYICRELMHKMNGDIFAEVKDECMIVTCVFTKA